MGLSVALLGRAFVFYFLCFFVVVILDVILQQHTSIVAQHIFHALGFALCQLCSGTRGKACRTRTGLFSELRMFGISFVYSRCCVGFLEFHGVGAGDETRLRCT